MPPDSNYEQPQCSGLSTPVTNLEADSTNVSLIPVSAGPVAPEHQVTAEEAMSTVSHALAAYDGKGTTEDEDRIFLAHGWLIKSHLRTGDLRQVSSLWEAQIASLVTSRESTLGRVIHKSAPLYNTGLAFFAAGDFDSALRYFIAADEEDMRNKGAHSFKVVIGDHPLSGQALVDPLVNTLVPLWGSDYRTITGCPLTADEIKSVLGWLASSPMDSVQTLIALHRFQRSLQGLENQASQHIRVRAIADMLIVLESNLKTRFSPTGQTLGGLLTQLLRGKPSLDSFKKLNSAFDGDFPLRTEQRRSPSATNWITTEALRRIKSSTAPAIKMGFVCSLAQHLRNGLVRLIEPSLSICSQRQLAIETSGLAFCALRIAKHGADNTL